MSSLVLDAEALYADLLRHATGPASPQPPRLVGWLQTVPGWQSA
jgi:hypothetical protein